MKVAILVTAMMSSSVAHAGPARCKDELVTGVVRRVTRDVIVVAIGADEAPLPVYERGWRSRAEVSHAKSEELVKELGIDAASAARLVQAARAATKR
ncbi:MAG: hypothetical protein M4D80_23965 [Myxococcota bacterium]|nr:hypothetical protein [Deltaproteobacteria bacterium]MDQ3338233.1 hypothetical protein [Myxococcota bacterium]